MTTGPVVRQATAWRTTVAAEHDVREEWATDGATRPAAPRVVLAATHFLPDHAGVAVTLESADGTIEVRGTSDPQHVGWALDHHRHRSGGRLFRFPGVESLVDPMSVGELVARSGIDEVVGLGASAVDPATTIDPQSFVRPAFTDGRVRLVVRPAPEGTVVPFEQPNPTPCCAAHD